MKKKNNSKSKDKNKIEKKNQGQSCVVEMNIKFFTGSCCDSSIYGHDFSSESFFLTKTVNDKNHQKENHYIYVMSGYKNKIHTHQVFNELEKRKPEEQIHLILYGSCLFQDDYFLKDGNYLQTQLKNLSNIRNIKKVAGCPPHANDLKEEMAKIIKSVIES